MGGGGSCDKSDVRHYDPKVQFLLIKVIYLFNRSEFVFIVAVFIKKKIHK